MLDIINNPLGMQYKVTYQQELKEWIYANRRRGAPKHTWARKATEHLWEEIRSKDGTWRNITLDLGREDIRETNQSIRQRRKKILEEGRSNKYYGGVNWGINQRLEDGGNDGGETDGSAEGRINRERQREWASGGNLRSTTRGTTRESEP